MEPSLPPAPGTVPRSVRGVVTDIADRLGTSVAAVVVVLVVASVGVVVVGWIAFGHTTPPPELTIPYADGVESGGSAPSAPAPTSSVPTVEVLVHAAGAVSHPGVYSLAEGARVGDLLAVAGGPVDGADLDRLNLAAPVADGSRVYVPRIGEAVPPAILGPDVSADADGAPSVPVDLNTADAAALESLPGIGPATAEAILAHREQHGPFRSVDDLLDVRGIGDAKLEALRDLVAV